MEKKKKDNRSIELLKEFAAAEKSNYGLSVLTAVIGVAAGMVPYVAAARIVSNMIDHVADKEVYIELCGIMLLGYIIKIIFMHMSSTFSHKGAFKTLADMRHGLLSKLTRVPMGFLQRTPSGVLKDTVVEKVGGMERFLAHMIPDLVACLAVPMLLTVYLFVIDWKMALTAFITLPISIICCCGMMVGYTENFNGFLKAGKHMSATVVEYVKGIKVIKIFNRANQSYKKYEDAVNDNAKFALNWMKGVQLFMSLSFTVMPSILVSVLPVGLYRINKGTLSAADFISIIIVGMGIIGPILSLMRYSDAMAQIESMMNDVRAVMEEPDIRRSGTDAPLPADKTIKLSGVSFSYHAEEDSKLILDNVDLTIPPNSVTAFVGPSGGGKSTIAKLIAGIWDVNSGSVTIGGRSIQEYSQTQLCDMITYVSQDNFLFNDTIMNNIRMGAPSASDEVVMETAKACGCHEFITQLENGYQTIVGSGGGHLSGGECQRIAIARAMMKNAPIVILDEATAFTDPENEAQIQEALAKLVKNKTLIVIAHRLSTVVNADKIVVVEEGRILQTGTHSQLLNDCPLYRKMWELYQKA
jgi:ATP-binding cassette subfamily B protein